MFSALNNWPRMRTLLTRGITIFGSAGLANAEVLPLSPVIANMRKTVPPWAKILTPKPARKMSVPSSKWKKAMIQAMSMPAKIPANAPTHGWTHTGRSGNQSGLKALIITPMKAAESIMPSSAMLAAPANSEIKPPSAGRIRGVEMRIMVAIKAMVKMLRRTTSIDISLLPLLLARRLAGPMPLCAFAATLDRPGKGAQP